jgi:hypothetical protein
MFLFEEKKVVFKNIFVRKCFCSKMFMFEEQKSFGAIVKRGCHDLRAAT